MKNSPKIFYPVRKLKISNGASGVKKATTNEHLIHILENTTPYQRMVWLKKAFEFWRIVKTKNHNQSRIPHFKKRDK